MSVRPPTWDTTPPSLSPDIYACGPEDEDKQRRLHRRAAVPLHAPVNEHSTDR